MQTAAFGIACHNISTNFIIYVVVAVVVFILDHFAGWARACRLDSAVMVAASDNRLPAIVLNDHSCNLRQFACHATMVDAVPVAANSTCWEVNRENQPQNLDKIQVKMDWTWHSDSVEDPVQRMCCASLNLNHLLGPLFWWNILHQS